VFLWKFSFFLDGLLSCLVTSFCIQTVRESDFAFTVNHCFIRMKLVVVVDGITAFAYSANLMMLLFLLLLSLSLSLEFQTLGPGL